MNTLFKKWRKSVEGLAYDELILVVAMVSSLGAFVAVSVPWDTVLKSSSAKVVDEFAAIELANRAFYDRYRLWPHETTTGEDTKNIAVLVNRDAMKFPYNTMRSFTSMLPEGTYEVSEGGDTILHTIGDGGRVTQREVNGQDGRYLQITMENVSLVDARKIDESIDGIYDPDSGRVSVSYNDTTANVHYRANRI